MRIHGKRFSGAEILDEDSLEYEGGDDVEDDVATVDDVDEEFECIRDVIVAALG